MKKVCAGFTGEKTKLTTVMNDTNTNNVTESVVINGVGVISLVAIDKASAAVAVALVAARWASPALPVRGPDRR